MSSKTIAIFTGYYLPHLGGVERYVDKLSKGLIERGYKVIIITSNHADLENRDENGGVVIYRLPIQGVFSSRYPIPRINAEYRSLMAQLEREAIDYCVLNTRFHLTSLVGARLAQRRGIPALLIEHGTSHFSVGNPVLDQFGKVYEHILTSVMKHYVKKYYGVSKKCNEWLEHYKISAAGVLYNAIDPADQQIAEDLYTDEFPKDQIVISYAGRLIEQKGILNLIDAFRIVKDRHPDLNVALAIAGGGPLEERIKSIAGKNSIKLLGYLNFKQVMSLYRRSDIFVYPSLYPEGLPTSILEAALMECAIIATPRGGTEEVIPDQSYGTIVDGSTESLVVALEELVMSSAKRAACGERVKERVQTVFSWESVVNTIEKEMELKK